MKKDYVIKRILAFMTDFIIVNMLGSLLFIPSALPYGEELYATMAEKASYTSADAELFSKYYSALANDAILTSIVFVFYFVVLAQFLGGSTLGCKIFKQKIVRLDGTRITYSDLTVRMLFTNGGIFYLAIALMFIPLASSVIAASILYIFLFLAYFGFLTTNFIFLLAKGTTIVDMMSKTRPLILLPKKL